MAKAPQTPTTVVEDDIPPPAADQSHEPDQTNEPVIDTPVVEAEPVDDRPAPPVAKVHRNRREVYERAKERRAAERAAIEQAIDGTPTPEAAPATTADKKAADKAEPTPAEPDATPAEPAATPQDTKKFTLKVNKQERVLTEDEVIAAAQQHLAAEDALPEVKRLKAELLTALAEAKNFANSAAQRDAAHQQPAAQNPDPTPTTESVDKSDERLRQIVNGLQIGDVDEGVKALKSLIDDISPQREATPSPDEIARQAAEALRREMAVEAANAKFREKHPEVYQDRGLAIATVMTLNDLCLEEMRGIGVSDADLTRVSQTPEKIVEWHRYYRDRGYPVSDGTDIADRAVEVTKDNFRKMLLPPDTAPTPAPQANTPAPAPASAPTTARTETRVAEKRQEQNSNPRRASAVSRPGPQAPKSTADVVAAMRASRKFQPLRG